MVSVLQLVPKLLFQVPRAQLPWNGLGFLPRAPCWGEKRPPGENLPLRPLWQECTGSPSADPLLHIRAILLLY